MKRPNPSSKSTANTASRAEVLGAPPWAIHQNRVADAVVDVPDVRDHLFQPKLMALRTSLLPWDDKEQWWSFKRVRDQGQYKSCVGHALAATIDHLRAITLTASKAVGTALDKTTLERPWVSWQMLHFTAQFHDEWSGEEYSGTSVRGGLKGFFYNGVCTLKDEDELLPRATKMPGVSGWTWYMTKTLANSARSTQLGAYYRVLPRLPDMHAALNEAHVIIVTASIHDGWFNLKAGTHDIAFDPSARSFSRPQLGLHAFAIVGYDETGFWVQNSWGETWGHHGLARWLYEDWAENISDAWVINLAVLSKAGKSYGQGIIAAHSRRIQGAETHFLGRDETDQSGPSRLDVLGHLVPFRDGKLDHYGPYNVNSLTLDETFAIIQTRCSKAGEARFGVPNVPGGAKAVAGDYHYRHVLIYFLGGWSDETNLANNLKELIPTFTQLGIYPFFVSWETALFKELDLLVKRCIDEVNAQTRETPTSRRRVRDQLIEGRIGVPGNRLLRELRAGARRIFAVDQPDPDALGRAVPTGQGSFCLSELFRQFDARYRSGSLSYHFAAHGFGAQLLAECLANQSCQEWPQSSKRFPAISSCTLISPTLAVDRASAIKEPETCLSESLLSVGERARRNGQSEHMIIEKLRLVVLGLQAQRLDRFSDDYARAWPELWSHVLGLDPVANMEKRTRSNGEPKGRVAGQILPLLSNPIYASKFAGQCRGNGKNAEIMYVSSQEDDVDSSLHHELGFHPRILDRIVVDILDSRDEQARYFDTVGRLVALSPILDSEPAAEG